MRFGANRSQIYDAQKTARAKWDATKDVWDDAARREHEVSVWEDLDQRVSDTLRAIDVLAVQFHQIRQDCEFQPY